jgi:hypothetical protein
MMKMQAVLQFPGISANLPESQPQTQSRLIESPPAFGLTAAVLAGLSAWAAGWALPGIATNFVLAAIVASFLSSYLANKAS